LFERETRGRKAKAATCQEKTAIELPGLAGTWYIFKKEPTPNIENLIKKRGFLKKGRIIAFGLFNHLLFCGVGRKGGRGQSLLMCRGKKMQYQLHHGKAPHAQTSTNENGFNSSSIGQQVGGGGTYQTINLILDGIWGEEENILQASIPKKRGLEDCREERRSSL